MALLFANNAKSTLAANITSSATTLSLFPGTGTLFPNPTGGDYFKLTLVDSSGNVEIVHCTTRSTDTCTIVRAQESTTARAFSTGAAVENRFTAGSIAIFNTYSMASTTEATTGTAVNVIMNPATTKYFWDQRVSSFGASLIDDADAATARTTLGLGNAALGTIGTTVQAYDANTMKSDAVTARTRSHRFVPVAVTASAGALAIDCNLHEECTITLAANTTVSAPTNCAAGKYVVIHVTGASTYTIGFNAAYKGAPSAAAISAGKLKSFCFRGIDGTNMQFIGATDEV